MAREYRPSRIRAPRNAFDWSCSQTASAGPDAVSPPEAGRESRGEPRRTWSPRTPGVTAHETKVVRVRRAATTMSPSTPANASASEDSVLGSGFERASGVLGFFYGLDHVVDRPLVAIAVKGGWSSLTAANRRD